MSKTLEGRKRPVLFLRSQTRPEAMDFLRSAFEATPDVLFLDAESAQQCFSYFQELGHVTILFCADSKPAFLEAVSCLVALKDPIDKGRVRALGFNMLGSKKVELVLLQNGCAEVLQASTTFKALQHKVEQAMMLVQRNAQVLESGRSGRAGVGTAEARVQWLAPLEVTSDFWLVEDAASSIRWDGKKWELEIFGPGSPEGQWVGGGSAWEWQPFHAAGLFDGGSDRWRFYGNMPTFNQKTLRWHFSGEQPTLALYQVLKNEEEIRDDLIAVRFRALETRTLSVARNSEMGRKYLPMIEMSLDIQFKLAERGLAPNRERFFPPQGFSDRVLQDPAEAGAGLGPDGLPLEWSIYEDSLALEVSIEGEGQVLRARFLDLLENRIFLELLDADAVCEGKCSIVLKAAHAVHPLDLRLAGVLNLQEGDRGQVLGIELTDARELELARFERMIHSRQSSINAFLSAARGIEI